MTDTILGTDIRGVDDIDPFLTLTDGPSAVAQAVMVSLLHPPGRLWWAPERGHDLRQHLHKPFDAERIRLAVQQQAELDERVESAQVTVEKLGDEVKVSWDLVLTQTKDNVTFTLTVSEFGDVVNATVTS